jgi:crossover junction endodeoxyribonuclease RuvC
MIILGVDPGVATVGYGIVQKKKGKKTLKYIASGIIETKAVLSSSERLEKIYKDLSGLIKKYRPNMIAIENIFFFKNLKTAMKVSEAKGVILLLSRKKKVPFVEISPLEMKLAISSYGKASKSQIKKMVKKLLCLDEGVRFFKDDEADALGLAICAFFKNNLL